MKSVRLLPVVILAACALLLFKSVGLITNGSYVLTGMPSAMAAGEAGDGTINVSAGPTLADTNPTLVDMAPTLSPPAADMAQEDMTTSDSLVAQAPIAAVEGLCGPDSGQGECPVQEDALAQFEDAYGNRTTLGGNREGSLTADALIARLSERRAELEAASAALDSRAALIEAAEKRLADRTATLAQIEANITAMVAEKKAMEDAQFAAVVGMYENMKPGDAAKIFDALDTNVLVRVARAMNPRKMAPVLAKMTTASAQDLTVRLATLDSEPIIEVPTSSLAALPQIVGQ